MLQSPHDFPAALLLVTRPEPAVWVRSAPVHTHTEQNRTGPLQNLTHRLPAPATHWAKHLIWCNIQFRIGCNYLRQASNPKKSSGRGGAQLRCSQTAFFLFSFFFFFLSLFHKSRPHHHHNPKTTHFNGAESGETGEFRLMSGLWTITVRRDSGSFGKDRAVCLTAALQTDLGRPYRAWTGGRCFPMSSVYIIQNRISYSCRKLLNWQLILCQKEKKKSILL